MNSNQFIHGRYAFLGLILSVSGCADGDTPDEGGSSSPVAQSKQLTETSHATPKANVDASPDRDSNESGVGKSGGSGDSNGGNDAAPSNAALGLDPDADTPTLPDQGGAEQALVDPPPAEPPTPMDPPEGAQRFHPEQQVWIDPDRRAVIVHGVVCFRDGPLEMFACPIRTKEHESVVAVYSQAYLIHAALLGVGAEKGEPVKFLPEFHPPTGTEIDVQVEWDDENGERRTARAQEWVRDVRTQQAMEHPWVFAGSGFWKDQAGNERYQAEAGDLICVSNFASATLDIPVESTQANEGLAFEAFTERIPPLGTQVRLILTPKLPPRAADEEEEGDEVQNLDVNENRPPL